MDLLTDLLQQAGVRRRLLDLSTLTPTASLRFPCEKSIGLHAVTAGRLFIHAPTLDEPLLLQAGDVAVMGRGCQHVLSLDAEPPTEVVTVGTFARDGHDAASGHHAQVISGAYQLWNDPLHPFLREMPPWFVLPAESVPRLGPLALTLGLLDAEVRRGDLGTSTIVHGLLDAVFTYALRDLVQRQSADRPGWSQAVADPPIRAVLAAMHEDIARSWTLDDLARLAGLSRTALAERFRTALGDTPLSHLRTLRMQKAMQVLSETSTTLEQVAQAVGYQDAFGFSKVFKRTTGVSPRAFRQQDALDKLQPWRLQAE